MKTKLYSVGFMFLLTLCFTSIVTGVKLLNQERISRNEQVKQQRVILDVLGVPGTETLSDLAVAETFARRTRTDKIGGRTVYIGQTDEGTVTGYAFTVTGQGFWGPIEGMVAVTARRDQVVGINFFRHTETPGLGARITEDGFRDQFRGLPVTAGADGRFFRLVPPGTAVSPGEVDGITGATQTSLAVERFLNREVTTFLQTIPETEGGST